MGVDALALRAGCPVGLGAVAHRHVRQEKPTRFPGPLRSCRALFTWPMQGLPFLAPDDWRGGLDFGVPWGRNRFRAPLAPPFEDGDPLPGLPGWNVLALPGHADDGIGLYHRSGRILIAGDMVRNFYGGEWNPLQVDAGDFSRSRARLADLEVECVLPGHGPVLEGERILGRVRDYPRFLP